MLKRLISAACLLLSATTLSAAEARPASELREVLRAAQAAHEAKQWPEYLEKAEEALRFRPGHPSFLYNLASAQTLNGRSEEALGTLARLAQMGLVFPVTEDSDFESIRDSAGFDVIRRSFERNAEPVNRAKIAFRVNGSRGIVEGITFDPLTRSFYVSSVTSRSITRIDSANRVTRFADETSGLMSAMGMKVDVKRRLLWVATAAMPQMRGYSKEGAQKSGVLAFNLDSGQLVQKVFVEPDGARHAFGDLVLDPKGDVYVTDSATPAIYRLRRGRNKLERIFFGDQFVSLQGLTFSDRKNELIVADYARGPLVVNLRTREVTPLRVPDNAAVTGIDGIYWFHGQLIAVQNGITPHRVVKFSLDRTRREITRVEVLEANHPAFNEPTLGVIAQKTFWFVGNSQWGEFTENGKPKDGAVLRDAAILSVPLVGSGG